MNKILHNVDFCVVGGGLAGLCAAVAAARRGARTLLMHERPMLGGNASSEIRMWVSGAQGKNQRETGIVEELRLANLHRNSHSSWSIWDCILYEKAIQEPNLTLLLNCSCVDVTMDGKRIKSVKGWQMTTQTWQHVEARLFADCSGDSILAPLSGAEFRWGRESREEFGEDIAPQQADKCTMGMSCLMQARQYSTPQNFIPPSWAYVYRNDEEMHNRKHNVSGNYWWIELGGEGNTIRDTEKMRDELLKTALGIWDHIKNHGEHGADNWALDWIGFLPGKRESRRYVGDHILTQHDVCSGGKFKDIVAYGGWPMDDHHPSGFKYKGEPTIFHAAPSPYGISYRCLYSRNIDNLFCAGRNISATHAAISSTRVMATCAVLGQAVGTAASLAVRDNISPRGVYENNLDELQAALLEDDCYLPGKQRAVSRLSLDAALSATAGDPESLRNGWDRSTDTISNVWSAPLGESVEYVFTKPEQGSEIRIIFDTGLTAERPFMTCFYPLIDKPFHLPDCLVRAYRLEIIRQDGRIEVLRDEKENTSRLVRLPVTGLARGVRLTPLANWGEGAEARVFAFEAR